MPGPVFISGDAVDLHTIEEEDLDFLQENVNDPRVWRPMGRSVPTNAEQEREFFEEVVSDEEGVNLLICADGTRVGTIGLHRLDERTGKAELGYWVAAEHRREGYCSEATELLVGYGFDQLRLHRIAARVFEFNDASRGVLEAVGFTQEGIHRDAEFVDGEYQDTYWYGLLAEEYRDGE